MANLIDQHMLSVFYDHPNLENITKKKNTRSCIQAREEYDSSGGSNVRSYRTILICHDFVAD